MLRRSNACGGTPNFCIESSMRCTRLVALILFVVSFVWLAAYAGTPGSFRGTVVEGDEGVPSEGWLYVRGRNGSIRRVDISNASIGYDESVPRDQQKPTAREHLQPGADVRVTAEQDSRGE